MNKQILYSGKWLNLMNLKVNNSQYQYVQRVNNTNAVVIIGVKNQYPFQSKYQLILQKRPTFDKYIIQFPAGLIDSNQTIEGAAYRELRQETGWCGIIKKISDGTPSSGGLSTELLYFATIELTNCDKVQSNEQNDNIVILPLMTRTEIKDYIGNTNYIVSSRVYCYFMN